MKLALPNLVLAAVVFVFMAPASAAADYTVDTGHTTVVFKVAHIGTPFYGMFRKASGTISFDATKPESSKITLNIDSTSIFTADKKRDAHLRGPDFLDAKQFPNITFQSSSVAAKGDTLMVTGTLTILGKSRTVTAKVDRTFSGTHPMAKKPAIGFHAAFSFKRSDFGINYMVGKGLGDTIDVMMGLEAIGG